MEQRNQKWCNKKFEEITGSLAGIDNEIASLFAVELPAVWAEKNINFCYDVSARIKDYFDLSFTPYLRAPLNSWMFFGVIKEVAVVAPEQTGKTLTWLIGLLWSMHFAPCLSLVIYPSDELGIRINKEKLEPLMKAIPKLQAELDMPRSQKRDCYHFSNLKSYFGGAGSRVTSQSAKIRIADECDDWISHEGKVTNLQDLRKRGRSFDESMFYKVCTPTTEQGTIWEEFEEGSQGYWFLRCQCCGKLTMRSADVHNLQWELDENGNIKRATLRLVCPVCKFQHTEDQKRQMNIQGEYIHLKPELIETKPSFQWGALASQLKDLDWLNIAKAQLKAGKTGRIKEQKYFDNSIRGLPFKPRRKNVKQEEQIKSHCAAMPDPATLENVFFIADTQDSGWYWTVRGIDTNANSYLLANGFEETLKGVDERFTAKYIGIEPVLGMIDSGGHRTKEVETYVWETSGMLMYKGDNRGSNKWRWSEEKESLILAKAKEYQADLLYYIYTQNNQDNNYWFLPPADKLSENYVEQISAVRANENVKMGHHFENWSHEGRQHDFFDCEKMYFVLLDVAFEMLGREYWRLGKLEYIAEEQTENKQEDKASVSSWMNGY